MREPTISRVDLYYPDDNIRFQLNVPREWLITHRWWRIRLAWWLLKLIRQKPVNSG